jgi:hypothetical protein
MSWPAARPLLIATAIPPTRPKGASARLAIQSANRGRLLACVQILMVRVLRVRKYGVYVLREVGERHHLPHAHIKDRGRRIASVFLLTGTLYDVVEDVPDDVIEEIEQCRDVLFDSWEELNGE